MNLRVSVTMLFIAALGFGIVGCRHICYEDPHPFSVKDDYRKITMDDVLHAAVRHKCLPQLLVDDTKVKCTSVQDPTNMVVEITLKETNNTIQVEIINVSSFKNQIDDYNTKVKEYDKKEKEYDELKKSKNLTREQKKSKEEALDKLEKDLDALDDKLDALKEEITKKFPDTEKYNDWVRAFENEIRAATAHRIHKK